MLTTIIGWFAMPLIRWGAIALAGLLFTGIMRADASRPYKQKVAELELNIAKRDEIIADHEKAAEKDRVEAEDLDKAIEGFAHAVTVNKGPCVLTGDQLRQLHQLAGINKN